MTSSEGSGGKGTPSRPAAPPARPGEELWVKIVTKMHVDPLGGYFHSNATSQLLECMGEIVAQWQGYVD